MHRLRNGDEVEIRQKSCADGPALGAMLERCSEQTYHYFHPYELTRESGERVAIDTDILCHVATRSDAILGYAWLQGLEGEVPTLGICIEDAWQEMGIGRLLTETSVFAARSIGKSGVRLTVNQDNARGKALYEKVGFELLGELEGRFPSYEMKLSF